MSKLSKKFLDNRPKLKKIDISKHLPDEWRSAMNGDAVYLEELSGLARADYLKALTKSGEHDDSELVIRTMVDAEGTRIFELAEKREFSSKIGSHALAKLALASKELSGFFLDPINLSESESETKTSSPSATGSE